MLMLCVLFLSFYLVLQMLLENNLETSSCQSADFCKERFIFHIPFYLKHFL